METCRHGCKKGKVFLEALGRFVPCPEHGASIERLLSGTKEGATVPLYGRLNIPEDYTDACICDKELFDVPGLAPFSPSSIHAVANILRQINRDVYSGSSTKTSMYIHVPNQLVDIRRFVYGVQRMAVEQGMDVTPYTSVDELYELQRVLDYSTSLLEEGGRNVKNTNPAFLAAVSGYNTMKTTGLAYRDFVKADLCIVRATALTTNKGWYVLTDLLDSRALRGLPTYVVGYWSTKTLSATQKYTFAYGRGKKRLDLLTPYEVTAKNSSGYEN